MTPDTASTPDTAPATEGAPQQTRRHRLRAGALIGVLTAVLGFGIAVQVHANSQSDSLTSLREDDLISILDNQNARADQLRQEIATLQQTLQQLRSSGDRGRRSFKDMQEVLLRQGLGVDQGNQHEDAGDCHLHRQRKHHRPGIAP